MLSFLLTGRQSKLQKKHNVVFLFGVELLKKGMTVVGNFVIRNTLFLSVCVAQTCFTDESAFLRFNTNWFVAKLIIAKEIRLYLWKNMDLSLPDAQHRFPTPPQTNVLLVPSHVNVESGVISIKLYTNRPEEDIDICIDELIWCLDEFLCILGVLTPKTFSTDTCLIEMCWLTNDWCTF